MWRLSETVGRQRRQYSRDRDCRPRRHGWDIIVAWDGRDGQSRLHASCGLRVKTSAFRRFLADAPKFHNLLLRYTLALMNQIAQSAACNRTHTVDERCARWLLMTHDRVSSDTFPLTQEFMAQMLGVHRPTVSVAAGMLQKAGLIRYVRGVITVEDRKGLESAACGCYRSITKQYERLLGKP
jgi:hypothetical protein